MIPLFSLSLSHYLYSMASRLLPRLFIPFGFTAGGTDSTPLIHTNTHCTCVHKQTNAFTKSGSNKQVADARCIRTTSKINIQEYYPFVEFLQAHHS